MKNTSYLIYVLIIILSHTNLFSQKSKLPDKLTKETYPQFEAFIKENAPSNEALQVVNSLANQHYLAGRAMVSAYVYQLYKEYFPDMESEIDRLIEQREQIALTQAPSEDMQGLYVAYIKRHAPSDEALAALQRLAEPYIIRQQFDSAAYVYNSLQPYFNEDAAFIQKIIDLLAAKDEALIIRNMGDSINTRGSEWDPNPTPDGRYLYFSADHRRGGYGLTDIWYSEFIDGRWSAAKNLGPGINGDKRETIDNVSADGTMLLLSGNFASTFGEFDIYFAHKGPTGWETLEHPPMPINSAYVDESANLTADGTALLFTSDRPGAVGKFRRYGQLYAGSQHGNMDLYVSLRQDDGSWGEPINLGSTVNTPRAERSAFLHPDGKTLYFSSEGHPGLGRMDIFKSTRLSDTSWTEWSEPINLGKYINSARDDWGYKVGISGDSAFFARENDIGGKGGWDLYTANVPEKIRPNQVATVKGKTLADNGEILSAEIIWENLETGEEIGRLRSDPTDGNYFIALPLGKNYGYYAELDGYYPAASSIDLREVKSEKTITEDIVLTSVGSMMSGEKSLEINNIFFDFDKATLRKESYPELDRLIQFLKRYDDLVIQIIGHTDEVGDEAYNLKLSENRAEAVKSYLASGGIKRERLKAIGFGATQPIVPNTTEENRARNRRVEIRAFK